MQMSPSTHQTRVKICGIASPAESIAACKAGASMLGLNFWPQSRRFVDVETAAVIAETVPNDVVRVGLFVNASVADVHSVLNAVTLDLLQFHGDESPAYCRQFDQPFVKAFRLQDRSVLSQIPDYMEHRSQPYLVDAFVPNQMGGTGIVASWDLAAEAAQIGDCMVLAGGLTPANVEEAIERVHPWAVDVASGVESTDGRKDPEQMTRFVEAVRRANPREVLR